ncbi:hypothetical protein PIIN_06140 [Serendipita indica DSM 11827]|uniref:Uncharacterized protein n=1 Tax=Serendipita indica (strain DSM 11827) TaxID=1109443 RepID=G4TLL2_SERID|nr:hypothetical protein PIIN_06140 [Serendipita indica DSM 11827]
MFALRSLATARVAVPRTVQVVRAVHNQGSMSETLHTTGKVHSLGHQHEYIPNTRGASSSTTSNITHGRVKGVNGVWCVAGASGETKSFGDVPMGAYAVSESFSPAWRRSL